MTREPNNPNKWFHCRHVLPSHIFCTGYSFLPVHNRLDRDSSLNGHTTSGPKSVTRHVSWHRLSCVTVASQRLLRLIAVRSVRDCYYSKCSALPLVQFTDLVISKARRQRLSRDVGACRSCKGMVDPPLLVLYRVIDRQ